MSDRPAWEKEGRDWPNRASSRFVSAAGLRWHVQVMGQGPVVLLLHGTAAATHSWRDLMPALARHFTVVAPDLPGHGFTAPPSPQGLTLAGMAAAIRALLDTLGLRPEVVAAHSAGAAVALRLVLDGAIAPRLVVALNGALSPMGRENADFFTRTARLLAGLPFVPQLFAWGAGNRNVASRLLRDTGSAISAEGVEFYASLLRKPSHLASALGMMASWDLRPLLRDLPGLKARLVLVVGANDRAIPPSEAERVRAVLPAARIITMPGLGHLAHEESPEETARLILDLAEGGRAAA
ncbi:alpha/beta fold hydrolase BchO [Muricoccus vinaceus]|uniref:Alpha/beta fold hydrolase BchO n=1 Tax=Muricoccus vinaceus TaxID=424704 RepID=A0ABV6J1U6_9PROT